MRCVSKDESHSTLLIPIHPDDAAFFDRERQPAAVQRNGGFTEQSAAPAVERRTIGLVVGRDLVEIVDGGDGPCWRRRGVPTSSAAAL